MPLRPLNILLGTVDTVTQKKHIQIHHLKYISDLKTANKRHAKKFLVSLIKCC